MPHRRENPHAGQGPVLLEIGEDVGALVLTAPATLEGTEIEIRALDGPAEPTHVEVLARPTTNGPSFTAVFPTLERGRYALRRLPTGTPVLTVTIDGGQVAQARWPADDSPNRQQ